MFQAEGDDIMDKNNNPVCVFIILTALLTVIFSYAYTYNSKSSEIIIIDNSSEKDEGIEYDYFNPDGFFGMLYGR